MGTTASVLTCRQSMCCVGEEMQSLEKDEAAMMRLPGFWKSFGTG